MHIKVIIARASPWSDNTKQDRSWGIHTSHTAADRIRAGAHIYFNLPKELTIHSIVELM